MLANLYHISLWPIFFHPLISFPFLLRHDLVLDMLAIMHPSLLYLNAYFKF